MSGKPQPKAPVYRQKPPTEAEARAHKRSLDFLAEDCKRVCTGTFSQPFANLQDAVERLLPFHIFGQQEGKEADFDEAANAEDCKLLCSRQEAWSDLDLRQAVDYTNRVEGIRQRLQKAEERRRLNQQQMSVEDSAFLEKFLVAESHKALTVEKSKPQGIVNSDSDSDGSDIDEQLPASQPAGK